MAIRPIGVSYVGNKAIAFVGSRKESSSNKSSGYYISTPLTHKLAIPAAALILSMYPSNNINAQDKFDTQKVTELYKKTNNFEILHSRVIENWGTYAEDEPIPKLTVHFISTDGNEDNIEGIILEKSISKYDKERKEFIKIKQFGIAKDKYTNEQEYFVYGDVTSFNKSGMQQKSNVKIKIMGNAFNYLTQFADSEVNNNAVSKIIVVED